jgi:hypothetical protein
MICPEYQEMKDMAPNGEARLAAILHEAIGEIA